MSTITTVAANSSNRHTTQHLAAEDQREVSVVTGLIWDYLIDVGWSPKKIADQVRERSRSKGGTRPVSSHRENDSSDGVGRFLRRARQGSVTELTELGARRLWALMDLVPSEVGLHEYAIAHPGRIADEEGTGKWRGRPTLRGWLSDRLDLIWPAEPRYSPTMKGAQLARQEAMRRDPLTFGELDPQAQRNNYRRLARDRKKNYRLLKDAVNDTVDDGVLATIATGPLKNRIAFARTITEEHGNRLLRRVGSSRDWSEISLEQRDRFMLTFLEILAAALDPDPGTWTNGSGIDSAPDSGG